MRRAALLLALVAGCGSTSRTPYGRFTLETHSFNRGSSCLSDSHSHLLGPDGRAFLDPLSLWEVSGDRRWAVAASRSGPGTLHLLDLEGGRVHSTHEIDRGELRWSPIREHLLIERVGALVLISFEPVLRVRTLFREEGAAASVRGLRETFWAPDRSGLVFLASPGPRSGPTRLLHARFDAGGPAREIARSPRAPNEVSIGWDGAVPRLD